VPSQRNRSELNRDNELAGLRAGAVRLGFLERLHEPELEMVPVLEDPTALLVGADHWLARRASVALDELADEHWVTRAGNHPLSAVLRRTTAAMGVDPRIAFEAHDYHEAQAMVAVGVGVALAPRVALTNLRDDVRLLILQPAPARRILLAWLRDRRATPAEDGLRTAIFQAADQLRRSFRRSSG
jgi:DNA-binding transcriptional LysR family regulator